MTTAGLSELQLIKGSSLGHFHKVEAFLGEGGFGVVAKCRNTITNKFVAIKVNKNAPEIYHQARQEIEILKQLRCLDPETCNIVQWNGYFFLKMNICLNFELLDLSLYHYMEGTPEKTLPITEVKDVLYQLSIALSHLSSIGIVHADLKPDNVMVVDRHQKPLRVKLIDFGLASRVSDCQPGMCVQTTWYRAPEVCLYSEFNEAIDMWSLGLTAAELAVGYPLYPGNMDYDVLSFIIATQGQLPDHVLDQGHATCDYFNHERDGPQRWRFKTRFQFQYETGCRPEDTRDFWLSSLDDLEELMEVNRGHNSDHGLLVDLIKKMMHLDQDQRIKPQEVLQHPFLTGSLPQNSSADLCNDMTNTEEAVPETRQQPSCPEDCNDMTNTEEAVPETRQKPSCPDVRIDMTDIKEVISEESQRPSGPDVRIDMMDIKEVISEESQRPSCPDVRIDMSDIKEAKSGNINWFYGITERIRKTFQSYFLMTPHRGLQRGTVTVAADSEEVELQPGSKTENVSWFTVVFRGISDIYQSYFHNTVKMPPMCLAV